MIQILDCPGAGRIDTEGTELNQKAELHIIEFDADNYDNQWAYMTQKLNHKETVSSWTEAL